jgi:tRNA(Ile)-lysidine synthase
MRFPQAVFRAIRSGGLVAPGESVLAAISGGPDSMALLHALAEIAPRMRVSLVVAHLDHGLRGAEGAADAAFVRDAAAALRVPAVIAARPVERARGESLEMAARRVRYAFLHETALARGSSRIATGHTADDQAETVLMRLFRGAGPRGLASIRPARAAFGSACGGLTVIRPLLGLTRHDVLDYLSAIDAAYRTDSSNAEPWALRNRVRSELLPLLSERVNPGVARVLTRFAAREAAIDAFLAEEASRRLGALVLDEDAGRVALNARVLAAADPAVAPYLVRLAADRIAAPAGARLAEAHVAACLALAAARPGRRRLRLPGGLLALRAGGRLELRAEAGEARAPGEGCGTPRAALALDVPGEVALGALQAAGLDARRVASRLLPAEPARDAADLRATFGADDAFAVMFDWHSVRPPLEVRSRRAGDRIAPRGMSGTKSLQNLFVDRKIPWTERDRVAIVADRERILWVVGLAATREAPVTESTRETLVVAVEPSASLRRDR